MKTKTYWTPKKWTIVGGNPWLNVLEVGLGDRRGALVAMGTAAGSIAMTFALGARVDDFIEQHSFKVCESGDPKCDDDECEVHREQS